MEKNLTEKSTFDDKPVTLMLLGSGLRFPAYIGALTAIEEKGLKIERIVGASAGSMIGSLYAAGKSPMEMKKIALETDITIFKDFSFRSLIKGKGLYEGRVFEEWMDKMLDGRRFCDSFNMPLFVITTDILNNTPFVFSRSNFPELKVSSAIRFSIGIPWVYSYKHFSRNGKKHVFIDGNLITGPIVDTFAKQGRTLILKVVSSRSVAQPKSAGFSFKSYMQKLLFIMMNAVEMERVSGDRWKDTIIIFCGDIPPTKFTISNDEKRYLFEQGYIQVKKYLEYKWGI